MTAPHSATGGATDATPSARLNFTVIDERMKELGLATTDSALGELAGLDRATIWRYRTDNLRPLLETTVRIADALGVPVQNIVERTPGRAA